MILSSIEAFEKRTAELLAKSAAATFDSSSSDDDESVHTDIQQQRIAQTLKRRAGNDNRICKHCPPLLPSKADAQQIALVRTRLEEGDLAVRASQIGASRTSLRHNAELCEVFPRWFAL